jgi:hypothetical protein
MLGHRHRGSGARGSIREVMPLAMLLDSSCEAVPLKSQLRCCRCMARHEAEVQVRCLSVTTYEVQLRFACVPFAAYCQ